MLSDGIVNVRAEGVTTLVAIEQRRENTCGQGGRDEERILTESVQDHLAKLPGCRMAFRNLQVIFRSRGLVSRCDASIDPLCRFEDLACLGDFVASQHVRYSK